MSVLWPLSGETILTLNGGDGDVDDEDDDDGNEDDGDNCPCTLPIIEILSKRSIVA
jgi:hypothetical protein